MTYDNVGTYGKVKQARHMLCGTEVAIKIVDKIHAPTVVREIETWRRLRHPHIAQLYEVLTSESRIYMVMELVGGGEIFDFITTNGPLPEAEAKRIFKQLAQAIKFCHDKKFVHR
jgi:serine/threonine protein kinase